MKITQDTNRFSPVHIVLDKETESKQFFKLFDQLDLMILTGELSSDYLTDNQIEIIQEFKQFAESTPDFS